MRILLGSIALVDDDQPGGITSPDYVVVRGRPGILHHRVFYYWLRSMAGEALIRELARGGVRERILFNRLCEGMIPVLPWPVQVRLAEQLAVIPRARAAAQGRLDAAEALPAAYLRGVFEGAEASGWETVDHACLTIDYGLTASAKATANSPRFLRITDIQDSCVNWSAVPGCDIDADDEVSLGLADGDIVFARTGATTGKSFLIRNPPRAVFASYLIRLRVDPAVALPDFVYLFFQSEVYWDQLRGFARGAAQPNVNATLLGQIKLPLPPLSDQRRIAADLAARLAGAERLAEGLRAELAAIEALPAALLRAAFQGND
jgi:type I restriction enzyme, S subunit